MHSKINFSSTTFNAAGIRARCDLTKIPLDMLLPFKRLLKLLQRSITKRPITFHVTSAFREKIYKSASYLVLVIRLPTRQTSAPEIFFNARVLARGYLLFHHYNTHTGWGPTAGEHSSCNFVPQSTILTFAVTTVVATRTDHLESAPSSKVIL